MKTIKLSLSDLEILVENVIKKLNLKNLNEFYENEIKISKNLRIEEWDYKQMIFNIKGFSLYYKNNDEYFLSYKEQEYNEGIGIDLGINGTREEVKELLKNWDKIVPFFYNLSEEKIEKVKRELKLLVIKKDNLIQKSYDFVEYYD